jgi:hypothetical protein
MPFGIDSDATGHRPSNGWIRTYGMYGEKNDTGSFFGLLGFPVNYFDLDMKATMYTGAFGFTGFKIILIPSSEAFFLGTSLVVNIGNN